MAKINPGKGEGGQKNSQNGTVQGKGDRVLFLISSGLQDVEVLAKTFNTVSATIEKRKLTDTEITVKLSKAETETQKEKNRHDEEMAKIEREWKKISDAAADRDRRLSFIQGQIGKFQAEYDKYLALEAKEFFSDTVTSRLESLRKVIVELVKELSRA